GAVIDELDQCDASRRSERGSNVLTHPGPPEGVSWRTHQDSGRARTSSQTFTTSPDCSSRTFAFARVTDAARAAAHSSNPWWLLRNSGVCPRRLRGCRHGPELL